MSNSSADRGEVKWSEKKIIMIEQLISLRTLTIKQ